MSLFVKDRWLDEVLFLELSGRITDGEGSRRLRDVIRRALATGARRVVIDLGEVNYIDSSGIGELVSGYTTTANSGGVLKLVKPTKRVRDLLQITKLYSTFEVFEDQGSAIRSFHAGFRYTYCPVCLRFRTKPPIEEGSLWPPQTCMLCATEFMVDSNVDEQGVTITRVNIQTYFDEYIGIETGPCYEVSVSGRLDRFSASCLRAVWPRLPVPRCVMFVLDERTEADDDAPVVAAELLADVTSVDDRIVFLLQSVHTRMSGSFTPLVPTYTDRQLALKMLQATSGAGEWRVPVKGGW